MPDGVARSGKAQHIAEVMGQVFGKSKRCGGMSLGWSTLNGHSCECCCCEVTRCLSFVSGEWVRGFAFKAEGSAQCLIPSNSASAHWEHFIWRSSAVAHSTVCVCVCVGCNFFPVGAETLQHTTCSTQCSEIQSLVAQTTHRHCPDFIIICILLN